ncbi:SPOR domain-containing protein [Rhizorhabdus dicambivorans]|uniref:Sporulation protein n=1 Tax=Rhizorhabdus dicambivorans TaxID=1850238 RepID=A0A2A4G1E2_9SPHN|nr:SPOR domain-containing protein [Rhizorhabdus dicambivorans]ATE65027.1 sporulation protein [Rhizorhabdus dicambivorans]PCE44301.1 sporulation protein [Rhizorhabdus dicambivorans]
MKSFFAGCALVVLAAATPALADVKAGVDAWMAGDFPKAVAEWRGPAAAGEPDAQFNLGQAYKLGRGVPADQAVAMDWYRKAAAAGHEQAQATLGLQLFQSGQRDEAMIWLKKAADQGEARAQYVVGTAYFNGDSLPKDWARAYALMTRAKAAGIGAATTSLTQMDQLVPEQQRQAGLALAREMERTEQLRASDTPGPNAPLTMRNARTPQPVGQVAVPASSPPPAPAPAEMAQAQPIQPWKAPSTAPAAATPAPAAARPAAPKPAPKPAATISASAGGGWKIQLGAFSSSDAARNAWTSLSARAGLKALSPTYIPVGNLTRLQAGPLGSRAAANEACAAVKSTAGTACFPVAP